MNFDELIKQQAAWLRGNGADNDVVISSRVRLARNVTGFPFAARATCADFKSVVAAVTAAADEVLPQGEFETLDMGALLPGDAALLHERQLVSSDFIKLDCPRALILQKNEELSVMVNEEDHLRMQTTANGFVLNKLWERINAFDNLLESKLDYAFDDQFGYLTACPSNVGTGMRASVLLHLPGLIETGELAKVLRSLAMINVEVRGVYGEGSRPLGECFQISNQTTLGLSEEAIIGQLATIVESVLKYEREARQVVLKRDRDGLLDRCYRALALLQSARILTLEEAMGRLSSIRLGVHLKLFKSIPITLVNELLVHIQPSHLKRVANSQGGEVRDEAALRAEYLRERLAAIAK